MMPDSLLGGLPVLLPRAEPPQGISTGLAQCSIKAVPLPGGVPGCPASGNLLPSPNTMKELIVLGRQDTL